MSKPANRVNAVALVTDAASPVGRAIALALAQHGWDLALHYSRDEVPAELTTLVSECQALGGQAAAIHCALRDENEISMMLPRVAARLGKVGCIVNNAAHIEHDTAAAFSATGLARHMQSNLTTPVLLAQALYTATLKTEGAQAVVINLLDQKLFNPQPDFLSYTLSKAALHSATALLAQAFAPQVRVVGIAPALAVANPAGQTLVLQAKNPATLEDVAAAVCFVAASSAITGSTLLVDGGQHLHPHPRDKAAVHGHPSHPH